MNDSVLKIVASQLGIPGFVVDELKASKPKLTHAQFLTKEKIPLAVLTVEVTAKDSSSYPVVVTLPLEQLKRITPIYDMAMEVAHASDQD